MHSSDAKTLSLFHWLALPLLAAFATSRVDAGSYAYVNVADSAGPYQSFQAPHLNDAGEVCFYAVLDQGLGIFHGPDPSSDAVVLLDAPNDPFLSVEVMHGLNDAGTVAFSATPNGSAPGVFTGPNPLTDAVATTAGPYYSLTSPVVSANGTVMFIARLDDINTRGIYRGPNPVLHTVVDTNGPYGAFEGLRINDAGDIAFHAFLDTGVQGIFTGSDPTLHTVATNAGPFQDLSFYPDINGASEVVFTASFDGTSRQGIFNGPDPVANAIVTNDGPYFSFGTPDLNDSGTVAFRADLDIGGVIGIFTGPDPVAHKVIASGDPLFGSTLTFIDLFDGLNERGDIAFRYALADGRHGIAVALVPEPASFALVGLGALALPRPPRRYRPVRKARLTAGALLSSPERKAVHMRGCLYWSKPLVLFATVLGATTLPAFAEARFQGLGDLDGGRFASGAAGISADGSIVVGRGTSASGAEAFCWTSAGGMVGLGDLPGSWVQSAASAVSDDGSIVVGQGRSLSGHEACLWTGGGIVGLGDLPSLYFQSGSSAVSGDGSSVVGTGTSISGTEAFRWTSGDGMVGLNDLPGGAGFFSFATDVSGDGSIVVGASEGVTGREAFRWTSADGMIGLGDLPGGSNWSNAYAISRDGSTIVGHATSSLGTEAFRWTSAGGMVGLGNFDANAYSIASVVSGDGSIILGSSESASGYEAFIWDATHGIRKLKDVLEGEYGLDLTGWTLPDASDISADGTTIVGGGINPAGVSEAWIAVLPEPASLALLAALGGLALRRHPRR